MPGQSTRFRAKRKRESSHLRSNALDLKKIQAFSQVGCTREEIAALLGIDEGWFNKQITKDGDLEEAILTGFANFKQSLRSTQARLALSGHPAMLIWLGKQYLGQSDKQETKQETTVNVVLQRAVAELRELDKDTVLEMKKLLEQKKGPLESGPVSEAHIIESGV